MAELQPLRTLTPEQRASNPSPEPDNSSHERMAPIEKLPTEILQQILGQLNARSFFSAKLSSPWLWAASKDSYGDDLVDTKTMKRFTKGRCFAQLEARLSASRPGRLAKKLTCSGCCRLCGNNAKGFSDDEFSLSDSTRKCIECLYKAKKLVAQSKTLPTQFKIKGISMFYCHTCGVVDKVENGMSERLTRAYLSKVWLPFGLNKVPGTLSSSGQWIESKDMPRQTSAHFIEEMSEFKPICRTCIIDGHSKVEVAIKDAQRSVEDIIKRVYGEQKPLAFLLGLKKRKSTF